MSRSIARRIAAALALAFALTLLAPRESVAGEKQQTSIKQRLGRLVPKWFRGGRHAQRPGQASTTYELQAAPVVQHERSTRPLIPRGSVEHKNAIETVTQDAMAKYGGRLPKDVIERISREAVDQVWHPDGIAITNFVSIIAQRGVKARADQLLTR